MHGTGAGTDVYGGPLDVLLNKGLGVAQWTNKSRDVFDYPFGWGAVWHSVFWPGAAVERAGGWSRVLKRHTLPFGGDEIRSGQWVPNYFGHVLEGGLAYRRQLEWNRAHGVPFPTLSAVVATQSAVLLNEAYETPTGNEWVERNGTAGAFLDIVLFDPLGMLLFHQDGVAEFMSDRLDVQFWPSQASISVRDGLLVNNGQAFVFRIGLGFTDKARLFLRGGLGFEVGLSAPGPSDLEIAVAGGWQSFLRLLDPTDHEEQASFGRMASIWIDRDGSLLFKAVWDERTDHRVSVNLFPGVWRPFGASVGAWFVLDDQHRPYLGLTFRRLLGVGVGTRF